MPIEDSPGQTAVAEKPASLELNGKHLEAAFAFKAKHHKSRILAAFGETERLPELPRGNLGARLEASEKRYRKTSDLLHREEPAAIPAIEDGISRELVITLADNLAWRGIEGSITKTHLDEIQIALKQLTEIHHGAATGSIVDLKERNRALKVIMLEDSHYYRDFFDSELATNLGLDSPEAMKRFVRRSFLTSGDSEKVDRMTDGISLEIAVKKYLRGLAAELFDQEDVAINFGSPQEDKEGGDVVVVWGSKVLYIDLKSARPGNGTGYEEDEIENGFRLFANKEKGIYKAVAWPEIPSAVANDGFRITDPALKDSLQKLVYELI